MGADGLQGLIWLQGPALNPPLASPTTKVIREPAAMITPMGDLRSGMIYKRTEE